MKKRYTQNEPFGFASLGRHIHWIEFCGFLQGVQSSKFVDVYIYG